MTLLGLSYEFPLKTKHDGAEESEDNAWHKVRKCKHSKAQICADNSQNNKLEPDFYFGFGPEITGAPNCSK